MTPLAPPLPAAPPEIGDPQATTAIASHLAQMANGLDAAALGFGKHGVTWSGAAAAAFAAVVAAQPGELARVAEACRTVSGALHRHAEVLAEAQTIQRRASVHESTDPVLARALTEQARATASSSGSRTARLVREAAEAAPDKPHWFSRLLRRGAEWMAEFRLGTMEAAEGAAGVVLSVNTLRLINAPGDTSRDATGLARGVAQAARDPMELLRVLVDWDTWTSNPARAAGHLAPDVVAAVASGGTSASTRAATVAARERAAVEAARDLDAVRRTTMQQYGTAARNDLVQQAINRGSVPDRSARTWTGEGGTRLAPGDAGAVDQFWFMVANREHPITTLMNEISAETDGLLMGTENRLKGMESFKRKIATQQVKGGGTPVDVLLARIGDMVRYTLVFGEQRYTQGVVDTAARLDFWGFHRVDVDNHWQRPGRYRGVNTTWLHARSGTLVEVQFHTSRSWLATVLTHDSYERMRLPGTPPAEKAQLNEAITNVYAGAPEPPGVTSLTPEALPPPRPPKPIEMPPDTTARASVAGAAATAGTVTVDRAADHDTGPRHLAVRGAR